MLIPPSFGGTCRCTSTWSPSSCSAHSTISVNRAFWNTPPVSATVSTPWARARAAARDAVARPSASWNPAASTGMGTHRSRSSMIARRVALTGVRRPRQSHPPWFPDRRNTTRHRDRAQVADAYERVEVGDEEFAAPHGAVGAVAHTVERNAEHTVGAAVLHHARRHVRVMMLHGARGQVE